MTTAARPTWNAAVAGSSFRDDKNFPATRQFGSRDLAAHTKLKLRKPGQNTAEEIASKDLKSLLFASDHVTEGKMIEHEATQNDQDADNEVEMEIDNQSDQDDDSDEDDTEELLRELEKIKKEREKEQEIETSVPSTVNPLIGGGSLKKKWYDDVIFKNQAKGSDEPPKKRFINDLIRSDFHRKFMDKYVK